MSADITIPEIQAHWQRTGFYAPTEWPEGSPPQDWVWTEEGEATAGSPEHGIFAIEQTYISMFYIQPIGQSIDQGKRRGRELRRQAVLSLKVAFVGGSFDETFNDTVDGIVPPYSISAVEPSFGEGEAIDWWTFSISFNVLESQ